MLMAAIMAASSAFAVQMTIVVDNPDAITPTYYDSSYNTVCRTLEGTQTTFEVEAGKTQRIYANNGFVIKKCTDQTDKSYTAYDSGRYVEVSLSEDKTFTFTTASDASLRDESFTLNLDDPAAVIVTRADNTLYGLKEGDNTVRFDQYEDENEIRIRNSVYGVPLVDVLVNNVSKGAGKTSCTLYVSDGDNVKVITKSTQPVAKHTVTLKSSEPGYFLSVKLGEETVTPVFTDGAATFEAETGARLLITGDQDNYKLNSIKVDGTPYWSTASTYSTSITKDTELEFDVTKYMTLHATIDIDDPTNVKVTQGYSYNGTILDLQPGKQPVEFTNRDDASENLNISAQPDCRIISVTVGTTEITPSYGSYSVTMSDGDEIVIRSEKIVRDKTLVVYRANSDLIDSFTLRFADNTNKYGFKEGYTTVKYADSDLPIYISWESEDIDEGTAAVYLNDAELTRETPGRDRFNISPADNSVLKIFHNGAPAFHEVTFDIPSGAGEVSVVRDVVRAVTDFSAPLNVAAGTSFVITVSDPEKVEAITVNEQAAVAGLDGTYTFTVSGPTAVVVTATGSGSDIPDGEWKSIGMGHTRGGLFGAYKLDEHRVYEIEIEQNQTDTNWYRTMLVNRNSLVARVLGAPAGEYFCFNIADPEKVYFEEVGFYGGIYFFSQICEENGWEISEEHPAHYARLADNVITWPALSTVAFDNSDGNWYNTNNSGLFAIALPDAELPETWKYLGKGKSYETTATMWYDLRPQERDVDVYESTLPGEEGKYLIENMFLEDFGSTVPLVVDTTDPDFGIIESQPTAITDEEYGSPYIMSRSYYYINYMGYTRDTYLASQYGQFNITRKGNRIEIPYGTESPYGSMMLYYPMTGQYLRPPYGQDAYIILPGETAVDAPAADAAAGKPQYFNLQGIPVANPSNGIYIMRQGGTATKTLIH